MAVEACNCTDGLTGWGLSTCFNKFGYPLGYAFQKLKDGAVNNSITGTVATPFDQDDWQDKLWNSNKDTRINTVVNVRAVADERADPNVETVDGIDVFVSEGARKITFEIYGVPSALKGFLEGLRCGEYGFYPISNTKNLGGLKVGATVQPIPMEKGTISVKEVFQTKTAQQKMMVTFQVSEEYNDSDFGFLPSQAITADLLGTTPQIKGLVSGDGTASASGTEEFTLDFVANNSTISQPIPDFTDVNYILLTNSTTSAVVTVASIAETSTGNYSMSYTAQTAADVLVLSYNDGSPVEFSSYTFTEV